ASICQRDIASEIAQNSIDQRRSQAGRSDSEGNIAGGYPLAYFAGALVPFDLILENVPKFEGSHRAFGAGQGEGAAEPVVRLALEVLKPFLDVKHVGAQQHIRIVSAFCDSGCK